MKNYIIKRTLAAIVTIMLTMVLLGVMFCAMPADRFSGNLGMSPQAKREAREKFHLNDPKIIQFGYWLKSVAKGEFGYDMDGNDLFPLIKYAVKNSLIAYTSSFIIAFLISIPIASIAACKPNGLIDRIVRILSSIFSCLPEFMVALFVGLFVNYGFKTREVYNATAYLTPVAKTTFKYYFGMILTLTLVICSGFVKMIRTNMIDVLSTEYVRTARSKGLKEKIVIYKHALKNGIMPIVTYMGNTFTYMISASITIEMVLCYNGMGNIMTHAIFRRQYWLMLSMVLIVVILAILVNYIIDIMYGLIDPRVRY